MKMIILVGLFISIISAVTYAEIAENLYETYNKFPPQFNLTSLNGKNGFVINGIHQGDASGISVCGVGDVNNDGIADILIAATNPNNNTGQGYVVFGNKHGWSAAMDLSSLDGKNGFVINDLKSDQHGISVSGTGDVNGDTIDDILMSINGHSAQGYVLFGSKLTWPTSINLSNLDGKNGFIIQGISHYDNSVFVVGHAGDINGDGLADILIGIPSVNNSSGQSYVLFGSKQVWPPLVFLSDLNGYNGVAFNGINKNEHSGWSVSGTGDVNGDSIDDILISAPFANNSTGQSYLVFGSRKMWPATIHLSELDGNDGAVINGINMLDLSGISVSGAGDINGDGIADFLIGALSAHGQRGQSYIIFGNRTKWPVAIDLRYLHGTNGVVINGINRGDDSGFVVRGAGDINKDGIADVLISAFSASNYKGQSYVIFGSKQAWPSLIYLGDLDGTNGFIINGINENDQSGFSVGRAGDVNGDGIDDIVIGAPTAVYESNRVGQTYVIFGE